MKPHFTKNESLIYSQLNQEQNIFNFEQLLKLKLPDSYKLFLKEINGGEPNPSSFKKPLDPLFIKVIDSFFYLDMNTCIDYSNPDHFELYRGNLLYEWDKLQSLCGMPDFILRIAKSDTPSEVLLSLGPEDYGYVYSGHLELGKVTDYNEKRAKKTSHIKEMGKLGFHVMAYDFEDLLNSAVEMTDEEFLES